jgi:hypothetical protein
MALFRRPCCYSSGASCCPVTGTGRRGCRDENFKQFIFIDSCLEWLHEIICMGDYILSFVWCLMLVFLHKIFIRELLHCVSAGGTCCILKTLLLA